MWLIFKKITFNCYVENRLRQRQGDQLRSYYNDPAKAEPWLWPEQWQWRWWQEVRCWVYLKGTASKVCQCIRSDMWEKEESRMNPSIQKMDELFPASPHRTRLASLFVFITYWNDLFIDLLPCSTLSSSRAQPGSYWWMMKCLQFLAVGEKGRIRG